MKERPDFNPESLDDTLYSTTRVAEIFGVSAETIRDWIKAGKFPAMKLGTGQIRVRRSDVVRYANQRFGAAKSDPV